MPLIIDYGTSLTKKFGEVFETFDDFLKQYKDSYQYIIDKDRFSDNDLLIAFISLFSRYCGSTISTTNEEFFKLRLFQLIWQYLPEYLQKTKIRDTLLKMNIEDIEKGDKLINNVAYNPNSEPSTGEEKELDYINNQSVTISKKNKFKQYREYLTLIGTDYTDKFVQKFSSLFIKVIVPQEEAIFYIEDEILEE